MAEMARPGKADMHIHTIASDGTASVAEVPDQDWGEAWKKGLAAFSVGRSDAVLFALALHLMDLLPPFGFGYLFLHVEKLSLREIKAVRQEEALIIDRIDEDGAYIEEEEKV